MTQDKMIPILRWVGSKKRIIDQIIDNIPKEFNNYYEPFLGSAIVFINMKCNNKIYLNDYNKDVMNIYNLVKNEPDKLIEKLEYYCKNYIKNENMEKKKEEYLHRRTLLNNFKNIYSNDKDAPHPMEVSLSRAALYIYINKTCFNGFMQFNKEDNNTSGFGQIMNPKFYKENQIYNLSKVLQNVTLENKDYKDIVINAQKGDFIYMDPPYVPDDITQCTIKYNKKGWTIEDYIEMVNIFKQLDNKGCYVMLSNSDCKFIRDNFENKYNIKKISIHRGLGRTLDKRSVKHELIIKNY
ncbi:MAG: hypothetical protein CMP54_04000 [Flavobacteriales bacterium]|nr:hypothetical protein [Flavobacteriales bacterium]